MLSYTLQRLIGVIPVILLVTLIVFTLNALIPGDPGRIRLGQRADPNQVEAWNFKRGYNAPFVTQYLRYLGFMPSRVYLEDAANGGSMSAEISAAVARLRATEALIAELIYVTPTILPNNIQVRAEKLMEKYPRVLYAEMDDVLLGIMQGNAGQVIDLLHSFGGGSGAALPATVVSRSMPSIVPSLITCQSELTSIACRRRCCVICTSTPKSCSQTLCRLIF